MDVPIIITTCDNNYNFEFQGPLGPYYDFDNIDIPRTSGTKEEQAFDVVVYDKENNLMHFIRVGSGADNKLNSIPATDNTQVECRSIYLQGVSVGTTKTLPTYLTGTLIWSSSDNNVVSVNDGVATAVAAGSARINVTDGNEIQSFYIKVN